MRFKNYPYSEHYLHQYYRICDIEQAIELYGLSVKLIVKPLLNQANLHIDV